MAVSIATGWVVWVAGPYRCGAFSDLRIARLPDGIQDNLDRGEKYIADSGYRDGGEYAFTPNGLNDENQRRQSVIRARHETVNRRFKRWGALGEVFRHERKAHFIVFMAIANMTQMELGSGEFPLFALDG